MLLSLSRTTTTTNSTKYFTATKRFCYAILLSSSVSHSQSRGLFQVAGCSAFQYRTLSGKSVSTTTPASSAARLATYHYPRKTTTTSALAMSSSSSSDVPAMVVDPFCYRQFAEHPQSKGYAGTVFDVPMEEFTNIVNKAYSEDKLQDGYAPFCKHVFIKNDFTQAQVCVLEITPDNEHLLRTKYEARNDKELPVLTRSFPRELVCGPDAPPLPVAKYIDLILYSREQIQKENSSMGKEENKTQSPWGIVSIKAQDVDHELPMQPITVMRNALGKDEGGSGVTLERDNYMKSYEYWNNHAVIS